MALNKSSGANEANVKSGHFQNYIKSFEFYTTVAKLYVENTQVERATQKSQMLQQFQFQTRNVPAVSNT